MAIEILELHHHGIRVGPSSDDLQRALAFYRNVLGLEPDAGRPEIPTIGGFWMNVGAAAQIHLMGVDGVSRFAQGPGRDPSLPHVALAVRDVRTAKRELDRLGVDYWLSQGVVSPESAQLFVKDPFGNIIELHQLDQCRCTVRARAPKRARQAPAHASKTSASKSHAPKRARQAAKRTAARRR